MNEIENNKTAKLTLAWTSVYTPKHGSRLNMAKIGLSVLKRQCLDRRIPDMATMQTQWLNGKETPSIRHFSKRHEGHPFSDPADTRGKGRRTLPFVLSRLKTLHIKPGRP